MYKQFKIKSPSSSLVSSPSPPRDLAKQKKVVEEFVPPPTAEEPKDVMISYSHTDKVMMNKVKDYLEENGISVWVDKTGLRAGVDFLSKIGQAIIDAKMFISLLSENTIKSKYCQDELALAYVSNKPIFPVGLDTQQILFPKMNTGMKLQLARFDWMLLIKEEEFEEKMKDLVIKMKEELKHIRDEEEEDKTVQTHGHMDDGRPGLGWTAGNKG